MGANRYLSGKDSIVTRKKKRKPTKTLNSWVFMTHGIFASSTCKRTSAKFRFPNQGFVQSNVFGFFSVNFYIIAHLPIRTKKALARKFSLCCTNSHKYKCINIKRFCYVCVLVATMCNSWDNCSFNSVKHYRKSKGSFLSWNSVSLCEAQLKQSSRYLWPA